MTSALSGEGYASLALLRFPAMLPIPRFSAGVPRILAA